MQPRHLVYFALVTVVLAVPTALCALSLSAPLGTQWAVVIAAICAAGLASILSGIAFSLATNRRERMERALRDSESRFRELAELLPEIVFEADERGFLTFLNRKGLETSGYIDEDLGRGLHALDLVIEEDRQNVRDN